MTETEKSWIHTDYFSRYPTTPFITVPNENDFLDDFFKIIAKETPPVIKKALLTKLIGIITAADFTDAFEPEESFTDVSRQVKDYIDAGNGLDMSLDDFAKFFFQSKFYLDKQFKKAFGVNLIKYRNNVRMSLANQLLQKYSVTETAEKLAFQSIYSFSRAYKQRFGLSPTKRNGNNS